MSFFFFCDWVIEENWKVVENLANTKSFQQNEDLEEIKFSWRSQNSIFTALLSSANAILISQVFHLQLVFKARRI